MIFKKEGRKMRLATFKLIAVLFVVIGGYGLYDNARDFFIIGSAGLFSVILNLTTSSSIFQLLSYWGIIGALVVSFYKTYIFFF